MAMKTKISDFTHLPGNNCITTAIRNILNFYGYRYREAMIFGLAEGIGFTFRIIAGLDNPYLGGAGSQMLESFCRNLHLDFQVTEFDTDQDAWEDLREHIDKQIPIICQVDLKHLPYFKSRTHFAGHRVIPVEYNDESIFLADTGFRKIRECPISCFIEARKSSYPPHEPRRKRWSIDHVSERPFVEETVTKALYNVYSKFERQEPGYDLEQIFQLKDHLQDYHDSRMLYQQIEKAGTGGGLSRRMFAEFLDQSAQAYSRTIYELASGLYEKSGQLWGEIAADAKVGDLNSAPAKLEEIYETEKHAIEVFSSYEAEEL